MLRGEPDGVAVGLAGLRAAGLAHVGAKAFAEGDERADVGAHLVGDADDHLEVGADAGAVGGLFHLLEVAVAVGDGAGLLVEVGGGKDDVGERGGLGEEHVLHDDEGVLEGGGVDAVACDWVGVDDVEGGEFALGCGVEDLEHVEAGRRRDACTRRSAPECCRPGCSRGACRGAGPCRLRRASWRSRRAGRTLRRGG